MVRNKDLLSDKDLFRNTTDIIESAKDCKIHLTISSKELSYVDSYQEDVDYGTTGGKQTHHNMTIGIIKGVERFTILNHELGHVMFDSPVVTAKEMIKQWAMDYPVKYEGAVMKTYWGALNIIEDQRVESLMGKIWLNNAVRFNKARENLGKNMAETMANIDATLQGKGYDPNQQINPLQCLLAVRFFRDDIAKMSPAYDKAVEILDKVEGTGQTGGLIGLRMIKAEVDRYIKDMVEMCNKRDKEEEQAEKDVEDYKDSCDAQNKEPHPETLQGLWDSRAKKQQEAKNANKDWNKQLSGLPDKSEWFKESHKPKLPEPCKEENTSQWHSKEEEKKQQEELKKSLEDSKEDGSQEVQKIKETLLADMGKREWADNVREDSESRDIVDCGIPAGELARGMNKVFKKIQGQPKSVIGYEGDDVDIEAYIQNKSRGYDMGECMIDTKYVSGASILLSVDGSSSMDNHCNSMKRARDMVATLYKSIEGVPNINLEAIVWSGSSSTGAMEVTHVKSLSDTKKMACHDSYPLTPTHLAIQYSANMLRAMAGRKKLLIIITDGYPQHVHNGVEMNRDVLCRMANKEMQKALRKCPNILGMLITPSTYAVECCKAIFGKRFLEVNNMNDGAKVIIKQFKALVQEVLNK